MIKFKVLIFLVFLAPSIVFSQVSITATGSSNTFNVTYPANITSVPAGMMVTFFSNQTITGSSFLNLNGLGAFPILKNVNQTLSSGNILAGQPVTVIFDGANWQLLSVAAGTASGSQWTSTTGGTIFYNGGNVGIGTDVANVNLTLAPTYNLGWRYTSGNTSVAHSIGRASQGATPLQFNTTFNPGPTNPVFEFNSGAGNIITMLFNKNVGIGTGLPQNTLHVVGGVRIENLSTSGAVFSNLSGDLYVNTASGSVGVGTPNQIAYFGTSNSVTGSSFMTWNQTSVGFNVGDSNENTGSGPNVGLYTLGYNSTAAGSYSYAIGTRNLAIGNRSFALGNYANAIHLGSFVIGDWSGSSPSYTVSSGSDEFTARFSGGYRFYTKSDLSDGIFINQNGLGIGVTNPQNKLHVVGGARIVNLSTSGAVFSNLSGDLYVNTAAGSLLNFKDNLYTTAPNNTTYAAQLQVIGTTTDMDFVISPKGGGSILASAPDGTATGGNKRGGFGSIDLQRYRTQATQVASGTISVLIGGNYNTASGSMSFVGNGNSNTAAGTNATIVNGQQNLISAGNSWSGILNGSNNTISGSASNAFIGAGNANLVSGNFSVINGGSSNIASGSYSGIIAGIGNVARSFGEVVVGTYNTDYTPFSAVSFQSGDRIFTVGNGATSGTRSNAFTVLKNGNVALGNINPAYQYDQAITAIVGQESLAHYTVSDSPGELFIDNYSATTGEFVPEIFGSQIGVGPALVLGGETNNDSNVNDPEVVVVNGKFSDGSALGFKPLFAVKNAGSNRFQVAASGVVTIASLTSAGTYLVQSNAQGKLSLATSSSFSLWTIAGTNIFPQNDQNNLGIGLGSISSPGLVAGASRYLTLAANQTNTNGYPSVELLSVNTALNQPVSKLEFINVVTPFATKSNHARIQAYTGRGTVANGQLGFFTSNGTLNEVMRINENGGVAIGSTYTPMTTPISGLMVQGNLGVGTTAPGAKFHVKSNTSASPNLAMLIQNAGGSNILSFSDNGLLGLGTNLASRAYIEQFGSVGSTAAMFGLSGSGGVSLISSYPGIAFNGYYASSWTSIGSGYGADIDVNPADGLMSFNTFSNAASANSVVTATPRMTIMNSGNVGIATITPNSTLQVNGSFAGKIVTGSGGFTYGAQDFAFVDVSNIGATASLVLPNPTTCSGRIILWKRTYVGAGCTHNFTASGGANVEGATTYTTGSISIRKSVAFISDGTNWWVLYSF